VSNQPSNNPVHVHVVAGIDNAYEDALVGQDYHPTEHLETVASLLRYYQESLPGGELRAGLVETPAP
jgi:hypothetical protein